MAKMPRRSVVGKRYESYVLGALLQGGESTTMTGESGAGGTVFLRRYGFLCNPPAGFLQEGVNEPGWEMDS